jgi:hypothetical protein
MSRILKDSDDFQAELRIEEVFKSLISFHDRSQKLSTSGMRKSQSLKQALAEILILGSWWMQDRSVSEKSSTRQQVSD